MWGESDLPAPCIPGNCHAINHDKDSAEKKHRIHIALWRAAEQSTTQPARARTCPSRVWLRNGNLEKRIRATVAARRGRCADETRGTRRASPALSGGQNSTEKLYDVLQRLHDSSPNEEPITADLARLGLNIEQNVEQSHELAKAAHDHAPNEFNCAVTYAFSLYRLGRNAEALGIIQGLPVDQLHHPHAAVYAALLLAEAGQIDGAKECITVAENGFIRRKKMLDEAKRKRQSLRSPSPAVSLSFAEPSPTPTVSPQ